MKIHKPFQRDGYCYVQANGNSLAHAMIYHNDLLEFTSGNHHTPSNGQLVVVREHSQYYLKVYDNHFLQNNTGELKIALTPEMEIIGVLTGNKLSESFFVSSKNSGH